MSRILASEVLNGPPSPSCCSDEFIVVVPPSGFTLGRRCPLCSAVFASNSPRVEGWTKTGTYGVLRQGRKPDPFRPRD